MQLPARLRDKIDALLSADDKRKLSAAAGTVSLKYRRESPVKDLQISSGDEARAYVATRLPATWCSVTEVLNRFTGLDPAFTPRSVLDLGAGPGTATLAASEIWPDLAATLVEPNRHLATIGAQLLGSGEWVSSHLENYTPSQTYDLVIASYVFNEIDTDSLSILDRIWAKTSGALVLIEPGTPHGYAQILKARDHFRSLGVPIAAPCPHAFECPLAHSSRWCHFSVRVDRSRLHRQIKPDARLSYEDEKFSYVVLTRDPIARPDFRALGEPHGQKVISLETCQSNGSFELMQLSKRSDKYRAVKKMSWGDAGINGELL